MNRPRKRPAQGKRTPRVREASAPPAAEALEASGLAWWEFDVRDGHVRLSGLWNEMVGGERKPLAARAEELFALVPEEDRPAVAAVFYGALKGERVRLPHGRHVPRDYTHVDDIAGIAAAALSAPPKQLRHRVFYAASGMNPLVTAGEVAQIVREMVPSADIDIGPTNTPSIERHDLKFRGVLDVQPVEEQLGYQIRYRDIRAGMNEYADRYCEFLKVQGASPARRI